MEGDLGKMMAMAEKVDVWHAQEKGMKKDKNHKKLEVGDSRARDKSRKETKSRVWGRKILGTWSKKRGMQILKLHPVLDPSL